MKSFENVLQGHTRMRVTHLVNLVLREINLGNHFELLRSEVTLVEINRKEEFKKIISKRDRKSVV